jgi:ribosomal protein S18 acetylase RimI-like enzyme
VKALDRDQVREVLKARRDELVAVWPDADGPRLDEIVPRHLEREGFRLVAEEDGEGRLAGIAYGYFGAAGQWWHDIVAAAMTDAERARWLGAGHFEFVELAVRPDLRRRGLGGRLHDALLEGVDAATAVLSTQTDNFPALTLYYGRGWELVVREIDFGTSPSPYCVLGLELGGVAKRAPAGS